jgi:hypothetical protein
MNASSRLLGFALAIGSLLVLGACSDQQEGDRCDTRNGNSDCEAPLECHEVPGRGVQLCCPPSGTTPQVPECTRALAVEEAGVSVDAATTEDAGTEAAEAAPSDGSESDVVTSPDGSETPAEASFESGAEAASEAAASDGSAAVDGAAE